MRDARLILTCGLPGSGKTTLAMRIARERNALRLSKDEWLWALGTSPWDGPAGERVERRLWELARDVLLLDQSVVVDFGLWARAERDEMRNAARALDVGVELRFLDLPIEELWRRVDARNASPPWCEAPIGRTDLDEWAAVFEAPDAEELALFDPPPAPGTDPTP